MPLFYGFDISSFIYVLPAMIFALIAQWRVNSTFQKYSRVASERGMTGADAARAILDKNGLYHVQIETIQGQLTDHFDPKTNVIRLSEPVHSVASVAAVGVAAHEAGHAVQYAVGYGPMKLRSAIIPATNFGSKVAPILIILGILLSWQPVAMIGVILFSLSVLFQLITLPVEFNASRRALEALEAYGVSGEALAQSKKVLSAAAMTYVAALAVAIGNLLRLISIVNRSRRD